MQAPSAATEPVSMKNRSSILFRIGIPGELAWGYLGLLLFMVGDGVESGFLSPYLVNRGISQTSAAWIFGVYGFVVAIAGWISGALSDIWGPRRVILAGLGLWLVFEILFLTIGLKHPTHIAAILLTYGLRGLGYPLFAFGFLVWITVVTPHERMASAMGWFWFAFTGGLPTLGSFLAGVCVPRFGAYATLWISAALVFAGGVTLLLGVREPLGRKRLVPPQERPLQTLAHSISIAWKVPQIGRASLVRVINTAPEFGFLVFMPMFFTHAVGFTMAEWLRLLGVIFFANILANLAFGFIGDKFGWVRTIALFGGLGCTLTTLALYYVPLLQHSFGASLFVGALYGSTLAGYVPLSALMPSLAPDHKGAALALLNLSAGTSAWVGPAIVALLLAPLGVVGVMWVFAALYLVSGILAFTLEQRPIHEKSATGAEVC